MVGEITVTFRQALLATGSAADSEPADLGRR